MAFDVSFIYRIIDRYSAPLAKIERKTSRLNTTMARIGQAAGRGVGRTITGLDNLGAKLRGVPSLANSAGIALTAMGAAMPFNRAVAFEDAIGDLDKKFTFSSLSERSDFIKGLQKTGIELGFTGTKMAQLAFEAGKLNIAADDIQKFTKLSSQASVAFDGLPIEAAGQIIGDLKNRLSLSIGGVEELLDSVNILADNTTTNGGQILNVLGRMSSQFQALKFPPELAAGFSAFARQVSVSDELAASGLKQFTNKLIEMGHQADLQRAPVETINKVLQKIRDLPAGQQGSAIIDMFGLEASTFVQGLVNKGELLAETLSHVADKTNFAGSMQGEFERKTANASFKIEQMRARIDQMLVTIGNQLIPIFHDVVAAIAPAIEKFTAFVQENPGLIKMAALIAGVTAAFIAVAGAIGAVMLVFNPVALAITTFLTSATALVYAFWEPFKAFASWLEATLMPIFGRLGSLASTVGGAISGALDFFGFNEGGNTVIDRPAAQAADVASQGAGAQRNRLDGQIGVSVTGPGQVTQAEVQSDAPGNLGMNVATAGAM